MPLFDSQSRSQLRQMYVTAWRKRREALPMEPVEAQIADVIEDHPEYHGFFAGGDALEQDFTPEQGQSNPFLHLGLHLAIRDQVATDRPPGIRSAFHDLASRRGSEHDAEHVMLEHLGEALWQAQRSGRMPDEHEYLSKVSAAASR